MKDRHVEGGPGELSKPRSLLSQTPRLAEPANAAHWPAPATALLVVGVLLGLALRVREYVFNPSLWLDEASIAANLLHKGYIELAGPLAGSQAAPVGWLWAERTSVHLFGTSELSLRVWPFVSSLVLMLVFPVLARRLLSPWATAAATALLAVSPQLICYAADVKPYGSDALACILVLLALTSNIVWRNMRTAVLAGLGVAALCWVAFPAIFVAAVGFPVLIAIRMHNGRVVSLRRARQARLLPALTGGAVVFASLLAEYVLSLRRLAGVDLLHAYWLSMGGFAPEHASAGAILTWLVNQPAKVLEDPGRLSYPMLALALVVVGALAIAWRRRAGTALLILLAAPTAGLGVAAAGKYPLAVRLALWLIPVFLILLAGVLDLPRPAALAFFVPLVIVSASSIAGGIGVFRSPLETTDARGTYAYVASHWQEGDELITERGWSEPTWSYYAPTYHLTRDSVFSFKSQPKCPAPVLLTGSHAKRVWVVLNHHSSNEPANRTAIYLSHFVQYGTLEESFRGFGDAGAFLFDLSKPPNAVGPPLRAWVRSGCLVIAPPDH